MGWTKAQEQAITIHQCNMLVSAAAGSGKTAVLTERIVNRIATDTDIDRLLIMTFTKAAAAEMRSVSERLSLSGWTAGKGTRKDFAGSRRCFPNQYLYHRQLL